VTGVLREQLGFAGVVISDDMQMGAISEVYGFETAILKAIEAGIDILLFGNNLVYDEGVVARVIDLVESFVDSGALSEARIDLSFERIIALKAGLAAAP
jgi:beta-N-acetylhexosaminidase